MTLIAVSVTNNTPTLPPTPIAVHADLSVRDLVALLVPVFHLPDHDAGGRPVIYSLRSTHMLDDALTLPANAVRYGETLILVPTYSLDTCIADLPPVDWTTAACYADLERRLRAVIALLPMLRQVAKAWADTPELSRAAFGLYEEADGLHAFVKATPTPDTGTDTFGTLLPRLLGEPATEETVYQRRFHASDTPLCTVLREAAHTTDTSAIMTGFESALHDFIAQRAALNTALMLRQAGHTERTILQALHKIDVTYLTLWGYRQYVATLQRVVFPQIYAEARTLQRSNRRDDLAAAIGLYAQLPHAYADVALQSTQTLAQITQHDQRGLSRLRLR